MHMHLFACEWDTVETLYLKQKKKLKSQVNIWGDDFNCSRYGNINCNEK